MGLVRFVVDAHRNTSSSAQCVHVDWVRDCDYSIGCIRTCFSSGSLPALQTVLSEEDDARSLETVLELWISALSFNKRSFRLAIAAG